MGAGQGPAEAPSGSRGGGAGGAKGGRADSPRESRHSDLFLVILRIPFSCLQVRSPFRSSSARRMGRRYRGRKLCNFPNANPRGVEWGGVGCDHKLRGALDQAVSP